MMSELDRIIIMIATGLVGVLGRVILEVEPQVLLFFLLPLHCRLGPLPLVLYTIPSHTLAQIGLTPTKEWMRVGPEFHRGTRVALEHFKVVNGQLAGETSILGGGEKVAWKDHPFKGLLVVNLEGIIVAIVAVRR